MNRNPTIGHVARLAGVSKMTVSRVLNRTVYVSPEATERVKTAIEKLGYRPNELARSLRNQRSRTIGLIIPTLHDALFAHCAHAMAIVAKGNNYSLVVTVSGEDPSGEFFEAEQLLQRGVDGVAIISAGFHESSITLPFADGKPVVIFDRSLNGLAEDCDLIHRDVGNQGNAQPRTDNGHLPVGIVGREWRLYRVRTERRGYYMTVRGGDTAANAHARSATQNSKASNGDGEKDTATRHVTLFSSNFEPTGLCLGELLSTKVPVAKSVNCHSVESFGTGLAEICESAQDMGQVTAGLLLECIEHQSHPKRQG